MITCIHFKIVYKFERKNILAIICIYFHTNTDLDAWQGHIIRTFNFSMNGTGCARLMDPLIIFDDEVTVVFSICQMRFR